MEALIATRVAGRRARAVAFRAARLGRRQARRAARRGIRLGRRVARRIARRGVRFARRGVRVSRRWARKAVGRLRLRWHRSLQFRVVATTLAISVTVVAVLGFFLMQQIAGGLLNNKEQSARNEMADGLAYALTQYNTAPDPETFMDTVVRALQKRSGPDQLYDVVIKATPALLGSSPVAPVGMASAVDPDRSIPPRLIAQVTQEQLNGRSNQLFYTPTKLYYVHSPPVSGLAVGAPFGNYQLYYLFRLNQEQQTLQLVENTLVGVGIALVLLLAAIASLVTRWVVVPVRLAAQAAERLSAGELEGRMQVRGADDLARLAISFNEMAGTLQEKIGELENLSQVQRQFVSDVSHELRTPLTTIRIAADVLFEAKDQFDSAAGRSAELLQSQLERFESLLVDLLEISRYDANAATLEAESVDIRDLVLRGAGDAQQIAEQSGTKIELRLPGEPCIAEVDRRRVERILRNLLVNAIEHGEGRDVVVTAAGDRDAVAVAVRDHGVGLKPGEDALVFDRFWRADPARARTTGGTGLGLSIALEDALLHGGWLQAWGHPTAGSMFRLTLPRTAGETLQGSPLPLVPPDSGIDDTVFVELTSGLPDVVNALPEAATDEVMPRAPHVSLLSGAGGEVSEQAPRAPHAIGWLGTGGEASAQAPRAGEASSEHASPAESARAGNQRRDQGVGADE